MSVEATVEAVVETPTETTPRKKRREKKDKSKKKQPKVLIFTTPTCPWCRRAKRYFREKGIRFKEVDVTKDPRAAKDLVRWTGQMGVPVIRIGNHFIVGFDKPKIDKLLDIKN